MLFPAVPAGIPFSVGPVGPVGPDGTQPSSDFAGKLFPAVPAGIPFPALMGRCPHPFWLEY